MIKAKNLFPNSENGSSDRRIFHIDMKKYPHHQTPTFSEKIGKERKLAKQITTQSHNLPSPVLVNYNWRQNKNSVPYPIAQLLSLLLFQSTFSRDS